MPTGVTGHSMGCGLPWAHPGPSHHEVVCGEDPLTNCLPGTLTTVSDGHLGCPAWASAFSPVGRGRLLALCPRVPGLQPHSTVQGSWT